MSKPTDPPCKLWDSGDNDMSMEVHPLQQMHHLGRGVGGLGELIVGEAVQVGAGGSWEISVPFLSILQ